MRFVHARVRVQASACTYTHSIVVLDSCHRGHEYVPAARIYTTVRTIEYIMYPSEPTRLQRAHTGRICSWVNEEEFSSMLQVQEPASTIALVKGRRMHRLTSSTYYS
jgi:hypothetical protein